MVQEQTTGTWELMHNVVGKKDMQVALREVFKHMAEVLANTLGPDGATTTIEIPEGLYTTKDGYNILKHMSFARAIDEKISQLLKDIAGRVVTRSGDGTTSSVVAAHSMLHELDTLSEDSGLKSLRPKDIVRRISKIVDLLAKEIGKAATKIDVDNLYEEIYTLALIATNTDERFAKIIADIYDQTNNSMIELVKSPMSNQTTHEIVEGYRLGMSFIEQAYQNDPERKVCALDNNPYVILLDHPVTLRHHVTMMNLVYGLADKSNRPVVFAARSYDREMTDWIGAMFNTQLRTGKVNVIFTHLTFANDYDFKMLHDFAALMGTRVMTYNASDELTRDPVNAGPNGEVLRVTPQWEAFEEYVGECESMTIGALHTTAKGFYNKNADVVAMYRLDAQADFLQEQMMAKEGNFLNMSYANAKKRFAKLDGKLGIIYVGGPSKPERDSDFDAIDDAVRACESAYESGYNVGGTLIVPIIAERLRKRVANGILFTEENGVQIKDTFDQIDHEVLDMMDRVFRTVFARVLNNHFEAESLDDPQITEIVETSIQKEIPYNMITKEYDGKVINPSVTDIEILKAAASIITVVYTSNQLVTRGFHAQMN